jgi:tetratricopeptide (TPR) repeat protein
MHTDTNDDLVALGRLVRNTWEAAYHATMAYRDELYGEAVQLAERFVEVTKARLGPKHPEHARALDSLAGIFAELNRLDEAVHLIRRALAIRERTLGPEHPELALHLRRLGELLWVRGQQAEGEALMRRALAIHDRNPEAGQDWNVFDTLNALADALVKTDRLTEAEPLMRRTVAICDKLRAAEEEPACTGPESPFRRQLIKWVCVLLASDRLAEAEAPIRRLLDHVEDGLREDVAALQRAVEVRASHGPDHPEIAVALRRWAESQVRRAEDLAPSEATNFFGSLYADLSAEAYEVSLLLRLTEPLQHRAIAIFERTFGPEHPDVGATRFGLARLLQITGRLADAETLMRGVLADDERRLGADHRDLAATLDRLARLLQHTGRLQDAEAPLRRALAIRERSLGSDHPDVAVNLNNLAQLLLKSQHDGKAEVLLRRALAINEKSSEPGLETVRDIVLTLWVLLKDNDRLAEAVPLLERAIAIYEKTPGSWDRTWEALGDLARVLEATGRRADTEAPLRRMLAIGEINLGPDNPNVADTLGKLAQLFLDADRPAEAEPLLQRKFAILESKYGRVHSEVIDTGKKLERLARELRDGHPDGSPGADGFA